MPRPYDLGKRSEHVAETRARIVDAAAELFRTQGWARTTTSQIAAAADVAPGTVRNHFPTTESLAAAVADRIMASLAMPTAEVYAGLATPAARVSALAVAMAAYYERSQPWYRLDELDDPPLQAWADARARYEAEFEALVRGALDPIGGDPEAIDVIATLVGPAVIAGLAMRGRSMTEAAVVASNIAESWLATRTHAAD